MARPAVFFGHGSPMNALGGPFADTWRGVGEALGKPKGMVMVSAHWETQGLGVTAMPRPETIHDFGGFPAELHAMQYPAPGSPELAGRVAGLTGAVPTEQWGLDHGTWSVLAHVWPEADVPVVQLSINATQPLEYHLDIGTRLAPLRDQGVLIIGSGNIVHNLRRVSWRQPDEGFDWNRRFDEAAREVVADEPGDVLRLVDHADFDEAVPTPDHFIPLLHVAGVAAASGETLGELVHGYAAGSLSMTCVGAGIDRTAIQPSAQVDR